MGIVKKDVYKNTLVSYIGMVVGYVNLVLLYPLFLTTTQFGLFNLLIGLSVFYSLIASMGAPGIIVRYFPFFKSDDRQHNGFMRWVARLAFIGFAIVTLIYIATKPLVISLYIEKSPLFVNYFYFLIPLAGFTILYNFLEAFGKVIYRSVFSNFLREVLLKLLTSAGMVVLSRGWINFNQFIILYIVFNGLISLALLLSLFASKQFSFNLKSPSFPNVKSKEVVNYGLFTLLSSSVYVLWQKMDVIMLGSMAGLAITGVYGFYSGIALVINVPAAALGRTTYQIVANAWKSNDMKNIADVYYKTSIIQMVFGCLLFLGVVINKENLFGIISKQEYSANFNLFIVIGLSCLVDITGGLNTYIITTSHKYRLISIFVAIASVFCFGLTYLLIPIYGGLGAALAYLITITAFNFCNWFYLKNQFNLQPFSYKHLIVIGISAASFLLGKYLWRMPNLYADIVIRSGTTAVFYGALTYYFNVSVDINEKVNSTLARLGVKMRR